MCLKDGIIEYENRVFTNRGQSDVDGFAPKISAVKHDIILAIGEAMAKARKFRVIYGFHGNLDGTFYETFTSEEVDKAKEIATYFIGVEMIYLDGKALHLENFEEIINDGFVLFTWCDSDTYLNDKYPNKLKKPK
jgi:hypothetical protein